MSKRYTQLTEAERYHIYTMKKQGYTDTVIAQGMGRDRTTIWRELQRNTGQRGYRHQQAQHWAVARHRTKPKQVKLTPEVQAVLRAGLAQRWSPEQIAGVAGRPGNGSAPRPSTSILPGINGLAGRYTGNCATRASRTGKNTVAPTTEDVFRAG